MVENVLKKPGRHLEIDADLGTAFSSQRPKVVLSSLPELIKTNHTGNEFFLGKLV